MTSLDEYLQKLKRAKDQKTAQEEQRTRAAQTLIELYFDELQKSDALRDANARFGGDPENGRTVEVGNKKFKLRATANSVVAQDHPIEIHSKSSEEYERIRKLLHPILVNALGL
jgi:hypothetical protein